MGAFLPAEECVSRSFFLDLREFRSHDKNRRLLPALYEFGGGDTSESMEWQSEKTDDKVEPLPAKEYSTHGGNQKLLPAPRDEKATYHSPRHSDEGSRIRTQIKSWIKAASELRRGDTPAYIEPVVLAIYDDSNEKNAKECAPLCLPGAQLFLPAVHDFVEEPRDEKATSHSPRHSDEGSMIRTQIEKFSSVDPVDLQRHRDKGSASGTQTRAIMEWRIPWRSKNPRLRGRFLPGTYVYYRNMWNPEKPSPTVTWDMEPDKEPVPQVKLRVTQLMTRHF